jgi:hypothetical protein
MLKRLKEYSRSRIEELIQNERDNLIRDISTIHKRICETFTSMKASVSKQYFELQSNTTEKLNLSPGETDLVEMGKHFLKRLSWRHRKLAQLTGELNSISSSSNPSVNSDFLSVRLQLCPAVTWRRGIVLTQRKFLFLTSNNEGDINSMNMVQDLIKEVRDVIRDKGLETELIRPKDEPNTIFMIVVIPKNHRVYTLEVAVLNVDTECQISMVNRWVSAGELLTSSIICFPDPLNTYSESLEKSLLDSIMNLHVSSGSNSPTDILVTPEDPPSIDDRFPSSIISKLNSQINSMTVFKYWTNLLAFKLPHDNSTSATNTDLPSDATSQNNLPAVRLLTTDFIKAFR